MSVQEIKGKEGIQEYPNKRYSVQSDRFQDRLIQNMESHRQQDMTEEKTGRKALKENGMQKSGETPAAGMLGSRAGVRVSAAPQSKAVQPTEVRHMSYEESDNIEIAVTEGYTLKGKMEGPQVYVEAKYEDGRTEAFHVEIAAVSDHTQHMIERFALQTTQQVKNSGQGEKI